MRYREISADTRSRARRCCRRASWIALSACCSGAVHAGTTPAPHEDSLLDAFELGGHVELAYERLQNFDLDRTRGDNLDLFPFEVELNFLFEPSAYFQAYLQFLLLHELTLGERSDEIEGTQFVVEEAHATLAEPQLGLALQVGRQPFEDARQWLYDADLDGIRGFYARAPFSIELSASREALVQEDLLNQTETESVNNYVAYGAYGLSDEVTIGAYGIVVDRRDEGDRTVFLGLQSFGAIGNRLTFWLDAAHVRGREDDRDVRGYGFDVLGTYRFDLPFSPHVILGYAFGSGDSDPDDDRDGAFRQTGLQGNETEVGGLTPFRYYGEAFDPELSNLSIFTAGLGFLPREGLSADLVYHYYLQVVAADELRDSALDAEPTGDSRRLGGELDLVLGFEAIEDVQIRGVLGYFMPGRAFEAGADTALFVRLEAQYEF